MATTIGIVKSATETILGIGEVSIDNFTFKAWAGDRVANSYHSEKEPIDTLESAAKLGSDSEHLLYRKGTNEF
jgi:hypothetical protein